MTGTGESQEIRSALVSLRRSARLPIAFGGLLHDPASLRLTELSGAATPALRGLLISSGHGVGGKAVALARPCGVADYALARHISHEYDTAVAAEGLRSVVAVPVIVGRRVRGVLYGALRTPLPIGDRVFDAAVTAARDVEQALVARDEARRLLARTAAPGGGPGTEPPVQPAPAAGTGAWEEVRAAHGELRALAPRIADPVLREQLLAACARLSGAAAAPPAAPARRVVLAPREVDVLACVAAGATNAAASAALGIRPETVKGYLCSAMRKLGAHTRLEAVVAARRAGALP
ncbi:LuxR C-terminal-related transcriptional regulator [Streptomyces sp. NBC_01497]|uniref:LuxR C-terminal-related transcriptional regulator n=1 Tax=Streptomyces sp. NBC_01497 TaxID=2903885 RepID=UPI002E30707C|nr:LuxR C-terminal-related transcriptional regulator [Streptomyces sp. NBC_01497]